MVDRSHPDDLAQVRADLAAFRAHLTRARRRRRALPVLLAALLVALIPLASLAANPFTDLNPGSPHNGNIDAIYNAGITRGCDPDAAYCPNANVTREEMASFLARAAGLGGNPPVANALTAAQAERLGGFRAADLLYGARGGGTTFGNNLPPVGYTTAATVRLTAPGPGYMLLSASVNVGRTPDTVAELTLICRLYDETAAVESPALVATIPQSTAYSVPMSPVYLFPVPAAGARTYRLEVAHAFGFVSSAGGRFNSPTITALYVPFGTINTAPIPVSQP